VYRTIFLQPTEGFGSHLISHDSVPMPRGTLSSTFIFSSIGDALSRAYDSAKETVGDVADSVSETVSNAYDATVETVSNVADTVAETASSAYSSTVETLSDAADTVSETVSDGYDATRNYVEGVASGEKEINYWKVLGGAAIGVGAVAAAPFTGGGSLAGGATLLGSLAGAGTVAAAVSAGVAGAVVAANLDGDEEVHKAGVEAGRKQAKAEHLAEITNLHQQLERAMQSLKLAGKHFNAIIALNAVAIATANCKGGITDEDREGIEQFIAGVAAGAIPQAVQGKIESLYLLPPSVREAFTMAAESGMDMAIFDEIINMVVLGKASVHPQEAAFMQAWNHLKAA
jgi:hypothetical protein